MNADDLVVMVILTTHNSMLQFLWPAEYIV